MSQGDDTWPRRDVRNRASGRRHATAATRTEGIIPSRSHGYVESKSNADASYHQTRE